VSALLAEFQRQGAERVAELRAERLRLGAIRSTWREQARAEQLPPPGDWRIWYLRGGRGAGKTRTGAETLADWIVANPPAPGELREWAIVAPTFGDARAVCAEGISGLIRALGGLEQRGGMVSAWNRSEGVIRLGNAHVVYLDGANDGAFRIQGKNLSGLWADEVGLWEKWDDAWNESIRFAVRMAPARIVATGTPKMGHPLIKHLLESPNVVETHMRTADNAANLDPAALADLQESYGGSTLGLQELEGEFIEALEGDMLRRRDWRYYPAEQSFHAPMGAPRYQDLPKFSQIVCSWDTAVKDKQSADFYAGQAWGVRGADRFLLRIWHERSGFEQAKHALREMHQWAQTQWPAVPVRTIVEAAGLGPDICKQLEREIQGVRTVAAKGDKAQRAWAATPALEGHNCFLPGQALGDGTSYEPSQTPPKVQLFVEECSLFRPDLKHRSNDDQVDAWSQMVNWTRSSRSSASFSIPQGLAPQSGALAGADSWDRWAG